MATNEMRVSYLFLESSTDSSDEDILLILKTRTKRPKIMHYIGNVVEEYTDEEFRRNFRLKRDTCASIIARFEESEFFPVNAKHGGRNPITAETHILAFLWFAGNKSCMRVVAGRFGIAETSMFRIIQRVLEFLVKIAPTIIKFPSTREEKDKIEQDFRDVAGFPGILGCIDGSYISIRTPAHKIKSTYTNRHDMASITLQGICDPNRRFLDVFTGIPSKIHDSRVLKLSFINKELPNLCSNEYHIIGDAAYPLREWLLKPYPDSRPLTEKQKLYNLRFCATRVLIENTFGILKQRFRQLTRIDFHGVNRMSKFIMACCVLHNLCIDHKDQWVSDASGSNDDSSDSETDDNLPEPCPEEIEHQNERIKDLLARGEAKRKRICDGLK